LIDARAGQHKSIFYIGRNRSASLSASLHGGSDWIDLLSGDLIANLHAIIAFFVLLPGQKVSHLIINPLLGNS